MGFTTAHEQLPPAAPQLHDVPFPSATCTPHRTRRGAHTFFLRQGEVARWGGYTVNLIHYEDAAELCLAVLQASGEGGGAGCSGKAGRACMADLSCAACEMH